MRTRRVNIYNYCVSLHHRHVGITFVVDDQDGEMYESATRRDTAWLLGVAIENNQEGLHIRRGGCRHHEAFLGLKSEPHGRSTVIQQ